MGARRPVAAAALGGAVARARSSGTGRRVRRSLGGPVLVAAALLPVLTGPAAAPLPGMAPGIGAPGLVASSAAGTATVPAVASSAGTGRTSAVDTEVGAPRADMPRPPPVDMAMLPGNSAPSPLPHVTQRVQCSDTAAGVAPANLDRLRWSLTQLRLPELWASAGGRGGGVTLAVIDTGVAENGLLGGRLEWGGDYVRSSGTSVDCDGHGTAVAGIAASAPDPTTGFAGVAPDATVLAIRQSSPTFLVPGQPGGGSSTGDREQTAGDTTTLARAIVHAVALGAKVINISEVSCTRPDARGGAPLQAALHYAVQHDVVVVAAAGNTSGSDTESTGAAIAGTAGAGECPSQPDPGVVSLPGWYDEDVLTVAATTSSGNAAAFSGPGPWVDVAAPGQDLMSLAVHGSGVTDKLNVLTGANPHGQDIPINGTSFAAPVVSGLAALIRAKYPSLTARQVMDRITATAKGAPLRNDRTGYGEIDPLAALNRAPRLLPPPGEATADTGRLGLATAPAPDSGRHGALWGGLLALLAAATAAALAVGRSRPRR